MEFMPQSVQLTSNSHVSLLQPLVHLEDSGAVDGVDARHVQRQPHVPRNEGLPARERRGHQHGLPAAEDH